MLAGVLSCTNRFKICCSHQQFFARYYRNVGDSSDYAGRARPAHNVLDWAGVELRRNGDWQIIASQAHRYYEDPAVGRADEKKFPDYVGTFELAPGQTREVTAESGKLFVERKGKKEELFPQASDIFFRKNVEGRILFHYNEKGTVDSLIDRRNNEDVVWRKTK